MNNDISNDVVEINYRKGKLLWYTIWYGSLTALFVSIGFGASADGDLGAGVFFLIVFGGFFGWRFFEVFNRLRSTKPPIMMNEKGILLREYSESIIAWSDIEKFFQPPIYMWGNPDTRIVLKAGCVYPRNGSIKILLRFSRVIWIFTNTLQGGQEVLAENISRFRKQYTHTS